VGLLPEDGKRLSGDIGVRIFVRPGRYRIKIWDNVQPYASAEPIYEDPDPTAEYVPVGTNPSSGLLEFEVVANAS
jgi:hypothetical protein